MRINIPWGIIFIVGGLLLVYSTDVPAFIGWITVALGVITMILQVLAIALASVIAKKVAEMDFETVEEYFYRTSQGRRRPRQQTQKVNMRSAKSDGNVTVAPKQER